MKKLLVLFSLFALLITLTPGKIVNAQGQTQTNSAIYQMTDLGFGEGIAINDLGWITGTRYDENGIYHPFVWKPDTGFQELPFQGVGRDINNNGEIVGYGNNGAFLWSTNNNTLSYFNGTDGSAAPLAINDSGQIVGYTKYANITYDSVLWNSPDSPQIIGDLGGEGSWAYDINEEGIVVGEAKDNLGNNLAYMWTSIGGTQTLTGIGNVSTAQSINDQGQIAGSYFTPGESHDFYIWQDGAIQFLSDNYDVALGRINNNGTVVGKFIVPGTGTDHGFYWTSQSGLTDLTPDYPYDSYALDVNDNGYIVGIVHDANDQTHITLWKPVPEPSFTLNGKVNLLNFNGNFSSIPITVELRKHGDSATTITTTLQNDGSYTLSGVEIGSYDIAFEASHWLRKTVTDVNIYQDTAINVSLVNGDVDGDNDIDAQDQTLLRKANNSTPDSKKWNPNADLNGDNKVNRLDMIILINNLGLVGDL